MSEPVTRLLDLFDALPEPDKQSAVAEILRRRSLGEADIPPAGLDALAGELLAPPSRSKTLADLLAGITPDNLHGEWLTGPPVGAEQL